MTTKTNEEIAEEVFVRMENREKNITSRIGKNWLGTLLKDLLTQKDKETALAVEKERERSKCEHCYCQKFSIQTSADFSTVSASKQQPHLGCCMCGHRKAICIPNALTPQ